MRKYLLLFFLLFNYIFLFSQQEIKTPLVYLQCKKIDDKSSDELLNCFKINFKKDFYKMIGTELRSRNIMTNYHMKAIFLLVFDINGVISISEFEGSEDTKDILEKSLIRLNERIFIGRHKIIPAKDNNGNFVEMKVKIPFQYMFVRS